MSDLNPRWRYDKDERDSYESMLRNLNYVINRLERDIGNSHKQDLQYNINQMQLDHCVFMRRLLRLQLGIDKNIWDD